MGLRRTPPHLGTKDDDQDGDKALTSSSELADMARSQSIVDESTIQQTSALQSEIQDSALDLIEEPSTPPKDEAARRPPAKEVVGEAPRARWSISIANLNAMNATPPISTRASIGLVVAGAPSRPAGGSGSSFFSTVTPGVTVASVLVIAG